VKRPGGGGDTGNREITLLGWAQSAGKGGLVRNTDGETAVGGVSPDGHGKEGNTERAEEKKKTYQKGKPGKGGSNKAQRVPQMLERAENGVRKARVLTAIIKIVVREALRWVKKEKPYLVGEKGGIHMPVGCLGDMNREKKQ